MRLGLLATCVDCWSMSSGGEEEDVGGWLERCFHLGNVGFEENEVSLVFRGLVHRGMDNDHGKPPRN